MDSPSVFGAILDRDAGRFRVGPADVRVPTARRYIPGTLALETTWRTPTGWLVLLDALLVDVEGGGARGVLLRVARCVSGSVDLEVDCRPRFDYGRADAHWGTGAYGVAAFARGEGVTTRLRVRTDLDCEIGDGALRAHARIDEGRGRYVALSWGDDAGPRAQWEAREQIAETCAHWQAWLDGGRFPDHPWTGHLQRSALTLKGLTYAPTGAMVAAATTSLPETPGGERNWDYRYTWIRDSALVLWALYTLRFEGEGDDYYRFVAALAERDRESMQIMYSITGERDLAESELDHLGGYEGARPVRIGNGAHTQDQHDVWGELVALAHLYNRDRDRLGDRMWRGICGLVDRATGSWREPDQGIWEARGAPRHYTASKISCWLAADRGAKLAQVRGDEERYDRWRAAAAEIKADVLARGVDDRGVLVQHYETTALDASLLPAAFIGFLEPGDERLRATVMAIADELTQDGLVLRYRTAQTDDGLHGEEGTFTICSFWLVSAFVRIGEGRRARELCELLLSHAGPLALYAEEIDPHTGRHLGNFPQAFTHLALINALTAVIRSEADTVAP
jgi:GH15 family glucan-1,4-alpha-glucosidase